MTLRRGISTWLVAMSGSCRVAPALRLGGFRNLVVGEVGPRPCRRHFGHAGRQVVSAVIDVPDRPHVHVGIGALKLGFAMFLAFPFDHDSSAFASALLDSG